MKTAEIKCGNCAHGQKINDTQINCRRYPPTMMLIPVQTIGGNQLVPQPIRTIVPSTERCSEFEVDLALVIQ